MNPTTFIMATPTLFERMAEYTDIERLLLWNQLPSESSKWREINSLRMMQQYDERPTFPVSVYNLPMLQSLSMPIDFACIRHPQEWADRIEALSYSERSGGRVQVPASMCFQNCEQLDCTSSSLLFEASSFPSIKSLNIKWVNKDHVKRFPFVQLEQLQLAALPEFAELPDICSKHVHSLYLSSSRMENLNGIERFPNLLKLGLNSFSKLQSLKELFKLKSLQHLDVLYCPKLNDLEAIFDHPSIEEVRFICSHANFEPWRETIMKGRFKVFSATGANYLYLDGGEWVWPKTRKPKLK